MEQLAKAIDQAMQGLDWSGTPSNLYQPVDYILSQGGKRIRPNLTLIATQMYDNNWQKALFPATAFEMLHNFTLIHDDIMDKADLRRNKETVYKKWNTNIAILSGDVLFAKAFEQMLNYQGEGKEDLLRLFTKTTVEICEGQQYDLDFETCNDVTIEQYLEMIRLKTAVMLAACLKAGAIVGKANLEEQELLYKFGLYIGLAFQIQDDYLDVYADVAKFGKNVGGDIAENKKTYMSLTAFSLAKGQDLDLLKRYFAHTDFSKKEKYDKVKAIYETYHVGEKAQELTNTYFEKAAHCLSCLQVGDERKKPLIDFANKLVNRDY